MKTKHYTNYYTAQLERIDLNSIYSPKIQIHSGETEDKTNFLDINEESAPIIAKWLIDNFTNKTK